MENGRKGHTLPELLLATVILTIFMTGLFSVYVMMQRLWKEEREQLELQFEGRRGLDMITRKIMSGVDADIFDSGNRLQIRTDPNRTPSISADDITCEYKLSGTNMIYTPNVNYSQVNEVLISNVYKDGVAAIFTQQGPLVTVRFAVKQTSILGNYRLMGLASSAKLRNEQ